MHFNIFSPQTHVLYKAASSLAQWANFNTAGSDLKDMRWSTMKNQYDIAYSTGVSHFLIKGSEWTCTLRNEVHFSSMYGNFLFNQEVERSLSAVWVIQILYTTPFCGKRGMSQKGGVQLLFGNLIRQKIRGLRWTLNLIFKRVGQFHQILSESIPFSVKGGRALIHLYHAWHIGFRMTSDRLSYSMRIQWLRYRVLLGK